MNYDYVSWNQTMVTVTSPTVSTQTYWWAIDDWFRQKLEAIRDLVWWREQFNAFLYHMQRFFIRRQPWEAVTVATHVHEQESYRRMTRRSGHPTCLNFRKDG